MTKDFNPCFDSVDGSPAGIDWYEYYLGGKVYSVSLTLGQYMNGRIALKLDSLSEEGREEPFMTCSVNLHAEPCPEGEVWIKDWAENIGCLSWLIQHRIVEAAPTALKNLGFVIASRHKLRKEFK